VDHLRIGRSLRALRRRRRARQEDVARAARLSQSTISRIELGELGGVTLDSLGRVASSLGARVDVGIRWHGEGLDRLLDEAHAALVERVVVALTARGWVVATEVSFSIFGERGSVDVLAWHPLTSVLLVVEAKSVVPDVQATIHALDRKQRLGRVIARDRGWAPVAVARLLVVADQRTARRRIDEHATTFGVAFPLRGGELQRWLRRPRPSPVSGLWFLPLTHGAGGRQRIRRRSPSRDAGPRSRAQGSTGSATGIVD